MLVFILFIYLILSGGAFTYNYYGFYFIVQGELPSDKVLLTVEIVEPYTGNSTTFSISRSSDKDTTIVQGTTLISFRTQQNNEEPSYFSFFKRNLNQLYIRIY